MNKCFLFQSKCLWCSQNLNKNGPTILYKFKGCGKYHNKIMCNLCFSKKYGYELYENYRIEKIPVIYSGQTTKRDYKNEIVITNYEPPVVQQNIFDGV